jgi:membrane protease YdiL (CAAX protease family)
VSGLHPPTEAARPLRWGIGDFLWLWPGGVVASVVLASIAIGITGAEDGALAFAFGAVGQFGGWVAGAWLISRTKGRSLRDDFGFVVRWRDWWAVPAGIGVFYVAVVLILPLVALVDESQDVVEELENATSAKLVVIALTAGLLAPVCEELLFRGVLLRALRRRLSPAVAVGVSAAVFAFAHPLLDGSLGTFARTPAFFLLAVVSGIAALRTGDLSVSILLHVGFNFVTVVGALMS